MKQNSAKKVAVITGASSGIGAAIANKFLKQNLRVCLTDKNKDQLVKFSRQMALEYDKDNVSSYFMDVEERTSIELVQRDIKNLWGDVDILVNSAGIFEQSPILEMDEIEFQKILNVNLLGTFRTSQIFGKSMLDQKSGKIINIASIAAVKGAPLAGHYAASKAGISALSRSMAVEFAPYNVQVNTVMPGHIETPMMQPYKEQMKRIAAWRNPSKRVGQASEVADAVWFLASDQSNYITGSQITVDGGYCVG